MVFTAIPCIDSYKSNEKINTKPIKTKTHFNVDSKVCLNYDLYKDNSIVLFSYVCCQLCLDLCLWPPLGCICMKDLVRETEKRIGIKCANGKKNFHDALQI